MKAIRRITKFVLYIPKRIYKVVRSKPVTTIIKYTYKGGNILISNIYFMLRVGLVVIQLVVIILPMV